MDNPSICKFNFNASNDLVCSCFVLERTDAQRESKKNTDYAIHLVLEGTGTLTVGDKKYALKRGTLFFVNKGETFSIERNGMEYAYIRFYGRRGVEYLERLEITSQNRLYHECECMIGFWMECLAAVLPGNVDLLSESVLLYSLAHLKPKTKVENDVISEIIKLTGENFTNPMLSLSSISAQVGYHEKYISSLFTKQRGVTYTQYLRELRIKHAIYLIEHGVSSVKNVAFLSGYSDALYFSKIFKKAVGCTPKEYILNNRKGWTV